MKSILDLNVEELEEILSTNSLPDGVGLQGIEERKDFDKLFKHRTTPKYIAQALLKDKIKSTVLSEPISLKEQRLKVKEMELEVRKKRVEQTTFVQDQIYKRLQAIEDGMSMLIRGVVNINEKLDKLLKDRN